jgi:hypothetical protein
MALDVRDPVARVQLIPAAVEVFGDEAQLDDQLSRQVLCGRLTPFLAPQAMEGFFVLAHDHPGIRAADKICTVNLGANKNWPLKRAWES